MTCLQRIIHTVLQRTGTAPRRAVDLAVQLACETQCERETAQALATVQGMTAAWARASLIERIDGPAAAEPLWERVVTEAGCEVPEALLHRARVAAHADRPQDAALLLQLALQSGPDYDFFARAETLVRKCRAAFVAPRKVRIALLGSSTTALLRSVIEMLCLRDGLDPVIYEQPFGAYGQELLQDDSGLYRFAPEFIVLLLNWRDLGLLHQCPDASVASTVERLSKLWHAALQKTSAALIHCSFVPPLADPYYMLSSALPDGRARTIRKINERLRESVPDRVVVLDCERVAAEHAGAWEDPIQWSSAKLYPATSALPLLAEHVTSCIRAALGLTRKLLAVDLDNTLWGGIIGEDGLGGIRLGPPSAVGERYQDFQRYLKGMKERGVLLAVVSKNNQQDAEEVFQKHQCSVLQLDDFVAFRASWGEKAASIRQLGEDLRLGLDSFVFLDDNPAERKAVRDALPDVLVPEISGEPAESIEVLNRGLYFQALRLTAEDQMRSESYLATTKQDVLRQSCSNMEEYLAELCMEIECGPVDSQTAVRVAQLINKTNQFNLTTRRYSVEEVERRMRSTDCWFRWFRLRDRFADHGLIAVLLADVRGDEWVVDLWLMSCRVIGRGVEVFMFNRLLEAALLKGGRTVLAPYVPTAKNGLVKDLLPRLGFAPTFQQGAFQLDVAGAKIFPCPSLQEEGAIR
jgi:FkbH-like protein